MGKNHHTVLGHVEIDLESIDAKINCCFERAHGVFRVRNFVASMGDSLGAFAVRGILCKGKGSFGAVSPGKERMEARGIRRGVSLFLSNRGVDSAIFRVWLCSVALDCKL
jgi:hypothetical protein